LAPFTSLPWPWVFCAGALIHLAGTAVMAALFKRRGLSPAWALLYLAQPTLLAFSRTLMAEPLAAFQTASLLLLADVANPLVLGLVAGFAPILKLSQVVFVLPFVAVWVWRRPSHVRARSAWLLAAGALPGIVVFLWFNHRAYGHWLASGYAPNYATPYQFLLWLGLGLVQLCVAWPLLPIGLLRSRAAEAAGAVAVLLYLAAYGYHYRSDELAATLVVGARLHTSAIVALLPGYAALLASLGKPARDAALALIGAVAIALPFVVLRAVSGRRADLDEMRNQVLASLRPGCLLAYSDQSLKLLLPIPSGKKLHGPEDTPILGADLRRGICVDVLDPLSEPSTFSHPPTYADPFAELLSAWPSRDRSPTPALRLFWLDSSATKLRGTGQ
jgi:hypothetical protein